MPLASRTLTVLNAGSSGCEYRSLTAAGCPWILLPTAGTARSRKACASAPGGKARAASRAAARARALISIEQRLADALREEVVEEEVDLEQDAILASGGTVHRDDSFEPELHIAARPDHARVDRAGGGPASVQRFLHGDLDERNQPVERFREAHVLHERLQVQQAVLDREPDVQHVGVLRRRLGSGVVDGSRARARGHGDSHAAR